MAGRAREVSDEDILVEFFLSDDPVLVAKELAGYLGMSRQGVHGRLGELEDIGYLHSKKPGRDRIYWLTEEGRGIARNRLNRN